jgi:hypothetical protein
MAPFLLSGAYLERFPIRLNHLMVKKSREAGKLDPHFGSTKNEIGSRQIACILYPPPLCAPLPNKQAG